MAITAADVKKLRDQTGAGMMDAKKALTEADGDFERATELLRVSGASKVAKRSDRSANNGLVAATGSSLIQFGSETDFVAKNQEFVALAEAIELQNAVAYGLTAGLYTQSPADLELWLDQVQAGLDRARVVANQTQDARFYFDYQQATHDITTMKQGISTYLEPSRAQPASPSSSVTGQYRAQAPAWR